VGGVHGLAGSAALAVAVVPALGGPAAAFVYLGVFGLGSILGMAICSLVLSLPLRLGLGRVAGRAQGLRLGIGVASVAVGTWMLLRPLG
jgi:nickel/cobalt exporter